MTATQVFWLLFIFVPLTILWILVMLDVMRRPDLLGWHKALWLLAIIFFPWIGALCYLITRPSETAIARRMWSRSQAAPSGAYGPQGHPYSPPSGPHSPPVPAPDVPRR